jgi:hypothetical protein
MKKLEESQFSQGLKELIPVEISMPLKVRVLSIGCGPIDQVAIEYEALSNRFGTHAFNYVGVDLVCTYPKEMSKFPNATLITADILDCDAACLKANTFNLVILRHPDFVTYKDGFKKIIRQTVPYLLVENGILLVSLYHEWETVFFTYPADKPQHHQDNKSATPFDGIVLSAIYRELGSRKHALTDARTRALQDAAADKWMFGFCNRVNGDTIVKNHYYLVNHQDMPPQGIEGFRKIVLALNGTILHMDNMEFECCSIYMEQIIPTLAEYGYQIKMLDISDLGAKASPVMIDKATLALLILDFRDNKNAEHFFSAFDDGDYNKALRRASTVNSDIALSIINAMVKYKETLQLNPNEQAGKQKKNAFHYAAIAGGGLYDKLLDIQPDEGCKDSDGQTPEYYRCS